MRPEWKHTLLYWVFALYIAVTPALLIGGLMSFWDQHAGTIMFAAIFTYVFLGLMDRKPKFNGKKRQ